MTSLATSKDFATLVKTMKFRHLVVKVDKDAGIMEGKDGEEVFMRGIQKDGDTWIITRYNTKHVKWTDF